MAIRSSHNTIEVAAERVQNKLKKEASHDASTDHPQPTIGYTAWRAGIITYAQDIAEYCKHIIDIQHAYMQREADEVLALYPKIKEFEATYTRGVSLLTDSQIKCLEWMETVDKAKALMHESEMLFEMLGSMFDKPESTPEFLHKLIVTTATLEINAGMLKRAFDRENPSYAEHIKRTDARADNYYYLINHINTKLIQHLQEEILGEAAIDSSATAASSTQTEDSSSARPQP